MSFTADYPGSIVYPAHETNIIHRANNPKVIVLHTPEEPADNYESTPVWFSGPNRGGSTHYYSDNDGDWYQLVPEKLGAIANGVRGRPYPTGTNSGLSLNLQSVSVEIEGYAANIANTCPRGGRQWKAIVKWVLWEALRWNIPVTRAYIIGHYEVANNRTDPGTLNLQYIVDDVLALKAEQEGRLSMSEYTELKRMIQDLEKKLTKGQGAQNVILVAINKASQERDAENKKATHNALVFMKAVAINLDERMNAVEGTLEDL